MSSDALRRPWAEFRRALDDAGFHPARRLGQNFLLDENMIGAIVRDAALSPGDKVLEVGAGCGFLTLHLVHAGVDLTSVEIDERLLAIAQQALGDAPVRWLRCDVLDGKHHLNPAVVAALPTAGDWHVVSNLAYSISAPFLALIAELENPPASVTVLVQREVARRIVATPGTSEWGPLSLRLRYTFDASWVRTVPAQLFWPRPKVESAVVRLVRRPEPLRGEVRERVDRLVQRLFQHRRQGLARTLGREIGDAALVRRKLSEAGVDPLERGENLDLSTLIRLSAAIGTERAAPEGGEGAAAVRP